MRWIRIGVLFFVAELHFVSLAAPVAGAFTPEALPASAIVAVANLETERLLPDGTRLRLNAKGNGVTIQYPNGKSRNLMFYTQVQFIDESLGTGNTFPAGDPAANRPIQFFSSYDGLARFALDVASAKIKVARFLAVPSSVYLGTYEYVGWYNPSEFVVFDPRAFEFYRIAFSIKAFDNGYASIRAFYVAPGLIFAIVGSEGILSLKPNGALSYKPLKNIPELNWCEAATGGIVSCATRDGGDITFSLATGEIISQQVKGYQALALSDQNGKILMRSRENSDGLAVLDPSTGQLQPYTLPEDTHINVVNGGLAFMRTLRPLGGFGPAWLRPYVSYVSSFLETKTEIRVLSADAAIQYLELPNKALASPGELKGIASGDTWSLDDYFPLPSTSQPSKGSNEWKLSLKGNLISYSRDDVEVKELRISTQLGESTHLGAFAIRDSDFAVIAVYGHGSSSSYLLDLVTGRTFDLSSVSVSNYGSYGNVTAVEGRILARDSQKQYMIDLRRVHLSSRTDLNRGSIQRPQYFEIPPANLESCEMDTAGVRDAIDRKLLTWRRTGETVDETELTELLRYALTPGEIDLIAQIFQRLIVEDQSAGEVLFLHTDLYDRIATQAARLNVNPCLDDLAREAVHARLIETFKSEDDHHLLRPLSFREIMPLIVYVPFIKNFDLNSNTKREDLADRLATAAHVHGVGNDIFYSKLFYFAKSALAPFFGLPREFKTDLTVTSSSKSAVFTVLSTYPTQLTYTDASLLGFYQTRIGNLEVPAENGTSAHSTVKWMSNGHAYRAEVTITNAGSLANLTPVTEGPDYPAILKNGTLTGLMAVGTNLGKADGERTMNNYKGFYTSHLFKFEAPVAIDDMAKWLEEHIRNGDVSYFIKEAHSDGDEKNLFRLGQKGILLVGKKKRGGMDIADQVVYLLSPDFNDYTGEKLISNEEFGNWIRGRAENKAGPMIYINSSCNSVYKVLREIEAAKTPLLIDLPSITAVSEFTNWFGNTTSQLIRGIITGQNWTGMRWAMDTYSDVSRARTSDRYALPNEPEFEEQIRKALGFTVSSEVHIFDETEGREVNIDEFNHH